MRLRLGFIRAWLLGLPLAWVVGGGKKGDNCWSLLSLLPFDTCFIIGVALFRRAGAC